MTKKTILILTIIIALAFSLRIYNLTQVPPSPDWDEAALGYNAYSLLETARDEFGNFLPLSLRSFNDYKPAFYAYAAIPTVAIFGLNLFAVRLPSVIFGTLTVLGVFFLCEALRKHLKNQFLTSNPSTSLGIGFSLLTSFFLALSPWHLQFSRAAFEANSGLFLVVWGAVFLLWGLEKPKMLILSAVFYGLSLYAYHSSRVFVPIFLLGVLLLFKDKILAVKKYLVTAFLMGLILSLPALLIFISPQGRQRFTGVSIYSDQTGLLADNIIRIEQDQALNIPFGNLWHNRRFTYVSRFLEGYLWHFTPQWLFLSGDGVGRHHAPDMGLLYLIELPLVLLGIYRLLPDKGKGKYLVFLWFLVAPVASAPTNQVPHAVRSYFFLPTFQIFSALGIITLYYWLKTKKFGVFLFSIFYFLFSINVMYYLDMYYRHLPIEYGKFWQYGYKEAINETEKLKSQYQKIVFSGKLEQPYIFYLFYTKYDPVKYLSQGGSSNIDFNNWSYQVIDKYEFKFFKWEEEKKGSHILYVGRPQDFPEGVKVIKTIYYLDGKPAILLVER